MSGLGIQIVRWVLTPLAAIDGLVVGNILGAGSGALIRALASDPAVDAFLPLDARTACIAAAATFTSVIFGSLMAPSARPATAAGIFVVGSLAAWYLLGAWRFPESHSRSLEPSLLPFTGIVLGALLGVGFVFWRSQRLQLLELEPEPEPA